MVWALASRTLRFITTQRILELILPLELKSPKDNYSGSSTKEIWSFWTNRTHFHRWSWFHSKKPTQRSANWQFTPIPRKTIGQTNLPIPSMVNFSLFHFSRLSSANPLIVELKTSHILEYDLSPIPLKSLEKSKAKDGTYYTVRIKLSLTATSAGLESVLTWGTTELATGSELWSWMKLSCINSVALDMLYAVACSTFV